MSITVEANPRISTWQDPEEFARAVLDAAAQVPTIFGEHLPVEVVVADSSAFDRAMHEQWASGVHRTVLDVTLELLCRRNPRATVVVYGSPEERREAVEWGRELIPVLQSHSGAGLQPAAKDWRPVLRALGLVDHASPQAAVEMIKAMKAEEYAVRKAICARSPYSDPGKMTLQGAWDQFVVDVLDSVES